MQLLWDIQLKQSLLLDFIKGVVIYYCDIYKVYLSLLFPWTNTLSHPSKQLTETTRPSGFTLTLMDELSQV